LKLRQNNGWDLAKRSKREQPEIIAENLRFCDQHKAKTKIMYKINLNHTQLKKRLKFSTSEGLLAVNTNSARTFYNPEGTPFLKYSPNLMACSKTDLFSVIPLLFQG
jgi:predicted transcriptional regulator